MRYVFLILIFFFCASIGYCLKNKYKRQLDFLIYFNEFVSYLYLNIVIYKNNISEIINNYLIQHKNKNAKYGKIFQKKNNIYTFNCDFLNECIFDNCILLGLKSFIDNIGNCDQEEESKKINEFKQILNCYINKSNEELRMKGDLFFKLLLGVGVVIVILLW